MYMYFTEILNFGISKGNLQQRGRYKNVSAQYYNYRTSN